MPFADLEAFAIPIQVTKGKRPRFNELLDDANLLSPLPKTANKEYKKLLKKCWNGKFSARPDAYSIITQLESIYTKQVRFAFATFLTSSQLSKNKDWITKPFAYNLDKKGDTLCVSVEGNPTTHPAHAIWNREADDGKAGKKK